MFILENTFKRFYSIKNFNQTNKKLILISQDWTRPKDPPLSLGHASILANLKSNNIDVLEASWSVNAPEFSPKHISDFIIKNTQNTQTDVALGAFIWNEKSTKSILSDLKKANFPGRIILGGPQVSYVKKGLEQFYPEVDIFIRGYAETALVDFLKTEAVSEISVKGIHKVGCSDLGISATAALEELPSPFLTGLIQPQRFIRWETQRGCPFRCAFCQHRESDISTKRRQFSLTRILQEAEWITKNPIIQDVAILDPIFNSGPHYLSILDQLLKGKFTGKLSLQCRLEMVKKEFLEKITQLNQTAEIVLEFGLQTIHPLEQSIIDRPNNMKRAKEILLEIHKRQIKSEISLIFGLPHQTVDSFQKSIDFCLQHKVPVIRAFPLMLLRGTPLYYQKDQLGLIESNEIDPLAIDRLQDGIPHVVASPSFTYDDWKKMAQISESL
ncbi:hypothetical protein DLAC_04861 [Tieghemostelium lacteum]|uniref:Radical SAM core domain-containing protein n=1 Tax=Tieghemostelium lacteum TaxID=361077 RepID=A0A151ZJA7_TIELA|nr:hypothetical protein DLAC_04861 [Tieghemostelium lacteum]|eukprot:KYQ93970.1 hypothetical protein DLAC_04861 [Tieghemostelium lacteum]